jgi:RHS repeat-associated protein
MCDCPGQHAPFAHKFTGKERDSESGLDDFGARYNSSSLGRFMTPDWSAKPQGVPYAVLDDPQSLNLYIYVRNNPLSHADPDGHCDPDGKRCFWQKLGNWFKGNGFKTNLQLAPQGTVTVVEHQRPLTQAETRYRQQLFNWAMTQALTLGTMAAMEAANGGGGPPEEELTPVEDAAPAAEEGVAAEEGTAAEGSSEIPGHPFKGDKGIQDAYKHLEKYHGVPQELASERLHKIKQAAGLGATDNVTVGRTGDVYNATTGERIGSLTHD